MAAAFLVLACAAPLPWAGAITDASPAGSERWTWPLGRPGTIVRPYLAPSGPYAAGHRGIDLAATPGQMVLAPADGTVVFSGVVVDRPVVTLRVQGEVLASLEPVAVELAIGTPVNAGDPLGVVARGGHCDARCVHLGVRVRGQYVSPLLFLAGVPPAVLLPLN